MKKTITIGLMASLLLAGSTAAFASSASVTFGEDVTYDNTVTADISKSSGKTNVTITWFQPYEVNVPTADANEYSAYPAGGTLTGPELTPNAELIITAFGVAPARAMGQQAQKDAVYVGASKTGPWTAVGVDLTPGSAPWGQSDSKTTITLSDPELFKGNGFWVQVRLQDGNQDDVVKAAQLQVTTRYAYTYTYALKGKIVFVSAQHASTADPNVSSDQGFVDMLRAAFYEVDYVTGWDTLDPNKVAALNASDLVIVSRDTDSAELATDANEVAAWNAVTVPVMLLNSYVAGSDRWQWLNTADQIARQPYNTIAALDKTNPIFAGVAFTSVYVPPAPPAPAEPNVPVAPVEPNVPVAPVEPNVPVAPVEPNVPVAPVDPNATVPIQIAGVDDANNMVQWYDPDVASGYASFINSVDAGNGKVLAVSPDTNTILIAEWVAGTPFYADSLTPAGRRLFLSAGVQRIPDELTGWGNMNLNAVGQQIFLNAVAYMMMPEPAPAPEPEPTPEPAPTPSTVGAGGE